MKAGQRRDVDPEVTVTEWQEHAVRGFVSILGSKGGEKIKSSK